MTQLPQIILGDNPVENIQKMAPYLNEHQQYITVGMLMEMLRNGGASFGTGDTTQAG